MKSTSGQFLGRYELLLPIAKGGMAEVWAARLRGSRGFQKIVAIKTIRPGTIDDGRLEQMFLDEATLASEIHHPNVVGTIELGEHEGTLYHVMEWIEGESLSQIMKLTAGSGGIPLPIAVNLVAQACKGLQAAHDLKNESGVLLGVVHRDISPHNLLVTAAGTTKIVDFGIATFTGRGTDLTQQGELKGKFAYMAPEQISSGPVDCRTDIFAMGIVLFLLTTGQHPFQGDSPVTTLRNVALKDPAPPSSIVEGYPLELEQVVLRALSKDQKARWSSANEMLSALEIAMPQCHDGSFQMRVAEFMHQHFGDRFRERRAQLKAAQEIADRNLPPDSRGSASNISVASLRAVSVDGLANTPVDVTLSSQRAPSSKPGSTPGSTPHVDVAAQPPPRTKKALRWIAAGAVGGAVIALLPFAGRLNSTALREAPSANTAIAPAAAPPAMAVVPPAASSAAVPAPPGSTTANRSAQERADDEARTRRESAPMPHAAPAAPARAVSRPTTRPKSSQPESPPPPAPAPASPERPSGPDLWDRRY